MRVLYVIDSLEPGGTEVSLTALLPHLENTVARVCHLYPGSGLARRLTDAGIEVSALQLPGRYSPLRAVAALRREVRRWRPDLVHSQLWRSGMVARTVCRLCGVPLVHTLVNEPLASPARPGGHRWRARLLQRLDRATAPWVAGWIANSAAIAGTQAAALRLREDQIHVIYRGRDVDAFSPRANGPRSDGAPDKPVLLNVARLRPAKGQRLLLDALPGILEASPDVCLVLAGDGPDRRALEEHCLQLGIERSVRFLGYRSDVPELLRRARIFVFPSRHEGHPGALVEAMLSGLPVVSSDLPVHRETVRHGETGLLVPLDDTAAWAQAVLSLLSDPDGAERMGQAARVEAARRFDVRRAARDHEAVYRELAGRGHPAPVGERP